MKLLLIIAALFLYAINSQASLRSPFAPTIAGVTLPNTHYVGDRLNIIRGMAPHNHIQDLHSLNITDVLIFKNQTGHEVDKEIELLKANGLNSIHLIPFKWRGFASEHSACEQTIKALRLIKEIYNSTNRKLFFHCTVGEDRTGYLAGLWELLSQGKNSEETFQTQMCQRGYGRGNPKKPYKVIKSIREELTPLFVKMATLIQKGSLTLNDLDSSACQELSTMQVESVPTCRKEL